jgi:hypothetical protein
MRLSVVVLVGTVVTACVATPLPQPPNVSIDPELIELIEIDADMVEISGASGAVEPGESELRSTVPPSPDGRVPPRYAEFQSTVDGAFSAQSLGTREDEFFLEALLDDEDLFLLRFTGGPGTSIEVLDPGPDSDGDGSPDLADCAPEDSRVTGQRCP